MTVRDTRSGKEHFTRLKIPTSLFPRLISIPGEEENSPDSVSLVFLEEVVSANLDLLFPGHLVTEVFPFRITRDADFEIEEDEAGDLLTTIEESVGMRRTGSPVRVEVAPGMPENTCAMIGKKLSLPAETFYRVSPPLGRADLLILSSIYRPDPRDLPFMPSVPPKLENGDQIFAHIRQKDALLFHPYESFTPVITFLRQAAHDPDVLAIKITLYRVGGQFDDIFTN